MASEQDTDNPFIILGHIYPDTMRIFSQRVGMSFSRINMLHEIWHAGEISQKELQDRIGMEGSLMTRFAKQMEADGLIVRRTDPKDNRYTLVSLAPAGHQAIEAMDKVGDEFQEKLLEGVSREDQAALLRALKAIRDNVAKME